MNEREILEKIMDEKRQVVIRFRNVDEAVSEILARITDVTEVSGRWMIETDAGFGIGLEHLIMVDGRMFNAVA